MSGTKQTKIDDLVGATRNTNVTGTRQTKVITNDTRIWYRRVAGERFGPFSRSEIQAQCHKGDIAPSDMVERQRSTGEWKATTVKALLASKPSSGGVKKESQTHWERATPLLKKIEPLRQQFVALKQQLAALWQQAAPYWESLKKQSAQSSPELNNFVLKATALGRTVWQQHRTPLLLGVGAVAVFALVISAATGRNKKMSSRTRTKVAPAVSPTLPAAAKEKLRAANTLPGCPRGVSDGFDLARSSAEVLTLRVFLEEVPARCPPCAVRAHLADGTPLALDIRPTVKLPQLRAGVGYLICGRITARGNQRVWIGTEKVIRAR